MVSLMEQDVSILVMQKIIAVTEKGAKMPRYIEENTLINELHHHFVDGFIEDKWWNSTHVMQAINNTPTADVRENVRGEWILSGEMPMIPKDIHKCSLCEGISFFTSDYCPNCGAEMRGE